MKRFLAALSVSALTVFIAAVVVMAQPPDPLDSMIIENKAVDTARTGTPSVPAFFVQVLLTNKDTAAYMVLVLVESTATGYPAFPPYALLNRTATNVLTFGSTINAVNGTMTAFSTVNSSRYHDSNPDTFLAAGGDDGSHTLQEPPGPRRPVWELKFRHSSGFDSTGLVWLDSTRFIGQSCAYTTYPATDRTVNFVAGRLWVCPGADSLNPACITNDVKDVKRGIIPGQYALSQNYPNPFNANTQISFALPKAGKTTLEIFNILGQKVNTLANEYMTAGYKIVNWDGRDAQGNDVASGIYFYRLRAEDFLQTKKMLLMK